MEFKDPNHLQESSMQSLLLQCKVYNRIRKFDNAVEKGKACLDLALDNEQVQMEVTLELWRAYRSNHQQRLASVYKEKCTSIVKTLAQRYPDIAQILIVSSEDEERQIEMKLHLGILKNAIVTSSQLEQSVWHGKKCLDIAQQRGETLAELNACLLLAEMYNSQEQYCDAKVYGEKCLEINQIICDKEVEKRVSLVMQSGGTNGAAKQNAPSFHFDEERIMESLLLQCKGYHRLQKYSKAIESGVKCIEIALDLGNLQIEIEAALELWRAFRLLHRNDTDGSYYRDRCVAFVVKYFSEYPQLEQGEWQISDNDDPRHVEMKVHFAIMLNVISNGSRLEQAVWHGKKWMEIAKDTCDKCTVIDACLLVANSYGLLLGQDERFIRHFQECAKHFATASGTNDEEMQNVAEYFMESCYHFMFKKSEQYEKAAMHNQNTCELAERINDKVFLTEAYLDKCRLRMLMNQAEESLVYLKSAEKAAKNIKGHEKYADSALQNIASIKPIIDNRLDLKRMRGRTTFFSVLDRFKSSLERMEMYGAFQMMPAKFYNDYGDDINFELNKWDLTTKSNYLMRIFEDKTIDVFHAIQKCESANEARELVQKFAHVLPDYECELLMNDEISDELTFQECKREMVVFKSDVSEDFSDVINDLCASRNQTQEEVKGFFLTLYGTALFFGMSFENAEIILKNAITCFENVFESFHEDKNQTSILEVYNKTYKLLSKIQVQTGKEEEALLTVDLCRAKALQNQLTKIGTVLLGDNDTSYKIASLVSRSNCAILLYSWFGIDLYIFCVHNTKGLNGENMIDVGCHVQTINVEGKRYLGLEPTTQNSLNDLGEADQQTGDVSRHQQFCCVEKRAGPPTENDDEYSQCNQPVQRNPVQIILFQRLHEELLSPFLNTITEEEILIIPEGQLYSVPFAALPDPTTGCYLSEEKRLRFSPSIASLIIHQSVADKYYDRPGSLIIGNPSVDHIKGMSSLPGSENEAQTIATIISGVTPLIGKAATKQAVLERLSEVCLIHFACHINLNPSAIVLSPEGPLEPGDDSYLLKPDDVMRKNIHARLVVLSGCNSGRGKICAEGVVGIARAFLASGAAAVLVSLWRVCDHSTCEFMTTFYCYLLDRDIRRSASESLHMTINYMRRKYPDEPIKWSGFYLMGDDVMIDPESLSVLRLEETPHNSRGREPSGADK